LLFKVQKNNYATFYDDQSQNWSICFDSESQQVEFSKWVRPNTIHTKKNVMLFKVIAG